MPSSSLVQIGVKVGVEVEVEGSGLGLNLLFRSGGWVVGWVVGESEDKAKLNSSCS